MYQTNFYPVHIRLELKDDLTKEQERTLRRYGESTTGNSIVRELIIPSDMPLHHLHYAIQRVFGWCNSHLRSFRLQDEEFHKITQNTVRGWSELVGTVFMPPVELDGEFFWDDDYKYGSFNTWLKKKYTGPYVFNGMHEIYEVAQQEVETMLKMYESMPLPVPFKLNDESVQTSESIQESQQLVSMIDLTLEQLYSAILSCSPNTLLERLFVDQVIGTNQEMDEKNDIFPLTAELVYEYDFGDGWTIRITKIDGYQDLLDSNLVSEEEVRAAIDTVMAKYKPVCIYSEGISVVDDAGGLGGFADKLAIIYESDDMQEKREMQGWLRNCGWSEKKVNFRSLL